MSLRKFRRHNEIRNEGNEMTKDNEDRETYWDADGKAVPRRTRSEMTALLLTFREQIGPLDCWSLGALEELDDCWKYGIDDERYIRANGGRPSLRELGEPIRCYTASYKKEDQYRVTTVTCKTCGDVLSRIYAEDGEECDRCAAYAKPEFPASEASTGDEAPSSFEVRMKSLHKISPSDMCSWHECTRHADLRLNGIAFCTGHYYEKKSVEEKKSHSAIDQGFDPTLT